VIEDADLERGLAVIEEAVLATNDNPTENV
jgi:hypothetical protein